MTLLGAEPSLVTAVLLADGQWHEDQERTLSVSDGVVRFKRDSRPLIVFAADAEIAAVTCLESEAARARLSEV